MKYESPICINCIHVRGAIQEESGQLNTLDIKENHPLWKFAIMAYCFLFELSYVGGIKAVRKHINSKGPPNDGCPRNYNQLS